MKMFRFFKILNHKINKYDKFASNPFRQVNMPVTIIWMEDPTFVPKNKQNR